METKSEYIDSGTKFVKTVEDPSASNLLSNFDPDKCDALVDAVFNQPGIRGKLIIYDVGTTDNPVFVLENSLSVLELQTSVSVDHKTLEYNFFIGNELICSSGTRKFSINYEAKLELSKDALELLRKDCFVFFRRRDHTDITGDELLIEYESSLISESGCLAYDIMIQVYEYIYRSELGNENIIKEVTKILTEYSNSNKLTILAFDSTFTKSEREAIHRTARRLNMKSKQYERRITVSRKINRSNIVRQLLKAGGQNDTYVLQIPENFKYFMLD